MTKLSDQNCVISLYPIVLFFKQIMINMNDIFATPYVRFWIVAEYKSEGGRLVEIMFNLSTKGAKTKSKTIHMNK